MNVFADEQVIGQLEKRKGGYFYLIVPADAVDKLKNKRLTRLLCTVDKKLTFQCGLNHLGDGNFFVILSSKNVKALNKVAGDTVYFELTEDPDPLGVPMPEVLAALIEQDEVLKSSFEKMSLGKKRSIIHAITRIKDVDKQVSNAVKLINGGLQLRRKKE
ncbi:YdeI/OmpD-associated family protein [Dyadobacter sp. CY345]|uniref:YdeI/OmpD-associated family protein n=1 Tax=Dyadobacter sp. CY345 TaxID=2909335 RepID=UPI001F46BCD7|nr:YdeI/OmpD-associated family protein [Dyadobacter sp. CY345]MCF2443937.1 YdeI/OmpD-associated family protein [Dyadobacter sp. CY345]